MRSLSEGCETHSLTIRSLRTTRSSSSSAWCLARPLLLFVFLFFLLCLDLWSGFSSLSLCIATSLPPLSPLVVLCPLLSTYKYSHLLSDALLHTLSPPLSLFILPPPAVNVSRSFPHQFTAHTAWRERETQKQRYTWSTLSLSTRPDGAEKPAETLSV